MKYEYRYTAHEGKVRLWRISGNRIQFFDSDVMSWAESRAHIPYIRNLPESSALLRRLIGVKDKGGKS